MLGPPSTAFVAGLEAVVVAAALLGLGYLIVDALAGRRGLDEVDRWGLSLGGLCMFCLVLMVVHMATSGWLFTQPLIVVGTAVGIGIGMLWRRRRMRLERDSTHLVIAAGLVIAALIVWGTPVFRMMPLTATADTQLHNGWIDQLLAGETTPGATLTGDIPNYYPWLFHSLGALTTTITPGQTPYHALAPLQFVQIAGGVLALFALGRALTRKAITGVGAALLGAMSGGFGFVMLNGLDIVVDPRSDGGAAALAYQGDLLFTRSYNVAFHNIAPPFPRDLAFALLATLVLALALRARRGDRWLDLAAGCALGLIGLTGGESFLVGGLLTVLVVTFDAPRRAVAAARLLLPALAIYSLWFVPVAIGYARLEGFVSITHIIPVTLPPSAILMSWGLATPFALGFLIRGARGVRTDRALRLCLLFAIAAGILLTVSTFIPLLLGDAFDTLGRQHRYWPIFYHSVALIGALGFTRLIEWARARSSALAVTTTAVVVATAWASPVVANIALPDSINRYPEITAAMTRSSESLLHRLRAAGPGCIVAAPQDIARVVFSYTGYRLVLWTGTWLGPNRARIRWAGIYEHITPEAQRISDNKLLTTGEPFTPEWNATAARYGVDIVVTRDLDILVVDHCDAT